MLFWLWLLMLATSLRAAEPFVIEVVDDQTGRGVPLVELTTTSNIRYYTDSAGIVAFDEPGLMGQKVWFTISSYGYEFPADGFGSRGAALDAEPGKSAKLKIKRVNIAERLYRITGQGIYRDTVLAGRKPPIKEPLLNAQVVGQDSVQSVIYRGKACFFWGDTGRIGYPLGNFSMTGGTIALPGQGGLDPSAGLNIDYFEDEHGFTRRMVPMKEPGAVWADGFMAVKDDHGEERLIAHFSRVPGLAKAYERGLILFNDEKGIFERFKSIPVDAEVAPVGHPFPVTVHGQAYFYFPQPYPCVRVKADWKDVTDVSAYEAYTPLKQGAKLDKGRPDLDRDRAGKLAYSWKKNTPPVAPRDLADWIKSGKIKRDETPMRLRDATTNTPVLLHGSSVFWNDCRKKYVMIGVETFGASMLGEIWYAESSAPEGPWDAAVKVATHHRESGGTLGKVQDNMDLYNPKHHPFLDQQGGRIIYFEGTYTHSFSGNPVQTPRYEYNQLMYRLDLSDPRLKPAQID